MSGMFEPTRYKYKHAQKRLRHLKGEANIKQQSILFGVLGCQVTECMIINSKKKESLRLLLLRVLRKQKINDAKIIWRFVCNIPQTKKSLNSRMGSGVGGLENWIAKIKSKTIICEIVNIDVKSNNFKKFMERLNVEVGAWFGSKARWIIKEKNIE